MNTLKINELDKILVIAPHPDDEMLGCGGLLIKYGKQCDVLLVTDGRYGFFEVSSERNPEKVAQIRKKEFVEVMEKLDVNSFICLDIPNENLKKSVEQVKKISIKGYTKIFIPGYKDGHHEHVLVNHIIRKMVNLQRSKAKVFEYEVWTPINKPDYLLDISDVIEQKVEIVSIYKSQIECYDYVNMCKGLNGFRGCTNLVAYAEAYYRRLSLREKVKQIYYWLKNLDGNSRKV